MAEAITIARPYAAAVFRLAKEKNALARWSEMLSFLSQLAQDARVQAIIDDPKLDAADEGSLEAEIIAAAQPSEAQVASIIKQLQAHFGKTIDAQVKLDPTLIGGLKIVIGDTVIDASVRGQLQELAYSLKG